MSQSKWISDARRLRPIARRATKVEAVVYTRQTYALAAPLAALAWLLAAGSLVGRYPSRPGVRCTLLLTLAVQVAIMV